VDLDLDLDVDLDRLVRSKLPIQTHLSDSTPSVQVHVQVHVQVKVQIQDGAWPSRDRN